MTIGQRRERIAVVTKSRTQRADGGFDVTSSSVERWARVRPVEARENEQAGRLRGSTTYLIECDARGVSVTPDNTIIWKTRGDMLLNVREVRTAGVRELSLVIVAEAGAVNSG